MRVLRLSRPSSKKHCCIFFALLGLLCTNVQHAQRIQFLHWFTESSVYQLNISTHTGPTYRPAGSRFVFGSYVGTVPSSHLLTSSDVVVVVLGNRSSFDARSAIRDAWAFGHDNVYFVLDTPCPLPPSHRADELTCNAKPSPLPSNYANLTSEHLLQLSEEKDQLVEEQRKHGDLVIMTCMDSYCPLSTKLKASYEFVSMYLPDAKWVIKVDTDFSIHLDNLSDYLRNSLNASEPLLMGSIVWNSKMHSDGESQKLPQWQTGALYPPFSIGSKGHVVSRPVVDYVAYHQEMLSDSQHEDESLGIWLDQSSLKLKLVDDNIQIKKK